MTKSASPSRVEAVKVGKRWQAISRQIQKRGTVLCRSANRFFSQLRFSLFLSLSRRCRFHTKYSYIFFLLALLLSAVFFVYSFPLSLLHSFLVCLLSVASEDFRCFLSACLDLPLLHLPVSSLPALAYLFSAYLSPLRLP